MYTRGGSHIYGGLWATREEHVVNRVRGSWSLSIDGMDGGTLVHRKPEGLDLKPAGALQLAMDANSSLTSNFFSPSYHHAIYHAIILGLDPQLNGLTEGISESL